MCDIELGDIGDIGQSQCLNLCEERKKKKTTYDIVVGQCHQFYVTQMLFGSNQYKI